MDKTLVVECEPSDQVDSLMTKLEAQTGSPVSEQRLLYGSKQLMLGHSLSDYNIGPDATIHQVLRLLGGHCQVPCGIFDDPAMVEELKQAAATIRKAILQSKDLHASIGSDILAMNQMVRWINVKEEHASKIITTVAEYCLCQRVKTEVFKSDADYVDALKAHHAVMQAAMKAKQSMDPASCDALDHALADMAKMYTPA